MNQVYQSVATLVVGIVAGVLTMSLSYIPPPRPCPTCQRKHYGHQDLCATCAGIEAAEAVRLNPR